MEQLDVKTTQGRIRVYKNGSGTRKILLLHGGGCDSAMLSWREVMDRFGPEFTVYAPDLLGYGMSDKPRGLSGGDFYQKHIDAVRETADALGLERFALAGLSMGGAIAIGFALRYPERVSLLVPVDSWGFTARMPFHRLCVWYIHHTELTAAQYRWLARSKRLAKWSLSYSLIGDKGTITDALVDEVMDACKGDGAGQAMLDYQRSSCVKEGCEPYYGAELGRLEMPVVFITGEKDPLVPVRDVTAAAERAGGSPCYILKGCKHWSVKERPEEFVRIVRDALTGIEP